MKLLISLLLVFSLASCDRLTHRTYEINGKIYKTPNEYFVRPSFLRNLFSSQNFDPEGPIVALAFPREEIFQIIPEYNLKQGPQTDCCNTTFTFFVWEDNNNQSMQERFYRIPEYRREKVELSSFRNFYKVTGRFDSSWYYFSADPTLVDLPPGDYFSAMCSQILEGRIESCYVNEWKNSIRYSLNISHNNLQHYEKIVEYMFDKFEEWEI